MAAIAEDTVMHVIDGVPIVFRKGTGNKKYQAILPDGRKVQFGDVNYQQYEDKIGLWSHLDHGDLKRRQSYRARHGAQGHFKKRYSPAWFSWHLLW